MKKKLFEKKLGRGGPRFEKEIHVYFNILRTTDIILYLKLQYYICMYIYSHIL